MPDYAINPIDGARIAYATTGFGEPVMLVHGSALSKAIWRGFGYVNALASSYCVITVDLRGHGQSSKPHAPADYAMELVVADLVAVLDAAKVASTNYFGYSFGARAGFALARQSPARMRSFVSAGGTYTIAPGTIADLFFPDWEAALQDSGMQGFVDGWERQLGAPLDPTTRHAFLANDGEALLAYCRRTETEEGLTECQVARLELPTLLLAGSLDRPRLADSTRAAQLMPNARLEVLPGRDHGTTLVPAVQVLENVLPFLARYSAARPAGSQPN